MNEHESFSDLSCEELAFLAERELSSFVTAVTKLYGPGQATLSAQDWLDQSELINSPPSCTENNWRAVTIAASARLANRIAGAQRCKDSSIPHAQRVRGSAGRMKPF